MGSVIHHILWDTSSVYRCNKKTVNIELSDYFRFCLEDVDWMVIETYFPIGSNAAFDTAMFLHVYFFFRSWQNMSPKTGSPASFVSTRADLALGSWADRNWPCHTFVVWSVLGELHDLRSGRCSMSKKEHSSPHHNQPEYHQQSSQRFWRHIFRNWQASHQIVSLPVGQHLNEPLRQFVDLFQNAVLIKQLRQQVAFLILQIFRRFHKEPGNMPWRWLPFLTISSKISMKLFSGAFIIKPFQLFP
jgi:hypothetical protein